MPPPPAACTACRLAACSTGESQRKEACICMPRTPAVGNGEVLGVRLCADGWRQQTNRKAAAVPVSSLAFCRQFSSADEGGLHAATGTEYRNVLLMMGNRIMNDMLVG